MKTSLIVIGIIFLVVGALLYFIPMQNFSADTTTTEDGSTDVRTSSASIDIPVGWAYATAIIGFVLLVLGLSIPSSVKTVRGPRGPRGRVSAKKKTPKRKRKRALSKGTSVTKTTKTVRR